MSATILTAALSLLIFSSVALCQSSTVVATVNGTNITQEQIDGSIIEQLTPLQFQIFALRRSALDNYITATVLAGEAKRRGITVAELRAKLSDVLVTVPDSDVEKAYAENAPAFSQMSPDEVKQRLRLDMETQARMRAYRTAVGNLMASSKVITLLASPISPAFDGKFATGKLDSNVTFVEYADFRCHFCRDSYPVIKQLIQTYGNRVRFAYKNLPIFPDSDMYSTAAYCAGQQGKFWQFHDSLFEALKVESLTLDEIAGKLALDSAQFKACRVSPSSLTAVRLDAKEAKKYGLDGTPSFVINGQLVRGVLSYEDFKRLLDKELALVK